MRTCKLCDFTGDLELFAKGPRNKMGRRPICKECERRRSRLNKRLLKLEVFGYYCDGEPACVCCGEKTLDFLVIDHIDGGGNQHRKTVKHMYRWLKQQGYPSGFRILCANCNHAAAFNDRVCPHQTQDVVSVKISEL